MTKTLTDKWSAGNLNKSFYYLKFPDTETAEIYNLYDMEKFRYVQDSEKIDVLDEVPSYDEHNDLIQQNVNQESAIETYIERIKELEEENKNLKEQIHSMLFTDDVVQERYDKSVQKMHKLEDKLREAEYCLDLIEVHTGSIGQSEDDMNESLIAIMNICRKYFDGGFGILNNKTDSPEWDLSLVQMVELKGKVK